MAPDALSPSSQRAPTSSVLTPIPAPTTPTPTPTADTSDLTPSDMSDVVSPALDTSSFPTDPPPTPTPSVPLVRGGSLGLYYVVLGSNGDRVGTSVISFAPVMDAEHAEVPRCAS